MAPCGDNEEARQFIAASGIAPEKMTRVEKYVKFDKESAA